MKDKRRFPRRVQEESLSITVLSAEHMVHQGERIYCESVDVSAAGLQVILDTFVARDSRVEVWMVTLGNRQTYRLLGRISWVEGRTDVNNRERFFAGIQLLPSADSDFDRWLVLFEEEE